MQVATVLKMIVVMYSVFLVFKELAFWKMYIH